MIDRARRFLVPGLALAVATVAFAREARAANFTPACTGTTGDPAALITAITTANANGEADTITLAPGCTYELATVNTDVPEGDGANGLPIIVADGADAGATADAGAGSAITIVGNGATISRAAAAPPFRLLAVNGGALNASNLTLSNGESTTRGGGLAVLGGAVVLTGVTVSGNKSGPTEGQDYAGGIQVSDGALDLRSCTVSGNSSPVSDSGGVNIDSGKLTIVNSTIVGNTARFQGGGVYNYKGDVTIINSTIAGNTAEEYGGVFSAPTAITTKLTNTLVALNTLATLPDAGAGGDAGTTSAPDVGGSLFVDGGNNLIGDATGTPAFALTTLKGTAAAKIDPLLGPLANNGGPTQTRALLAGSPALDAANATVCAAAPVSGVDQRDVARPAACDIGAFELAGSANDGGTGDGSTENDGSIGTDDAGTINDPDSGKSGGNAGDDAVSSTSDCSCDNAGAPANTLGLSALVLGGAVLVARRRRRR
jgi:hypothetical protein